MGTLSPGDRLGGYEVLAPGNPGQSAVVYPVRDLRTGEEHALKHMSPGTSTRAFDHEYEVMSRLNHVAVLRTYRYGLHDDRPWFTMELLRGESSNRRVKDLGAVGNEERTAESLTLVGLAARALDYIHRRDVIHRDLKPANLVLLPDRRLRIVDFADALLTDRPNPAPGAAGTAGYAAPECLRGESVDARADLYALGATLYRLITGKSPFKAPNDKLALQKQQNSDYTPIEQIVPGLPRQLVDLVASLLLPDPRGRPETALEVAERIDLISGRTILSGSSLAIYDASAADPGEIAADIVAELDGFSVIYSDDHRFVRSIVESVALDCQARREPVVVHALDGDGREGLAEAITEISRGKIPLKHATLLPFSKLAGYLAKLSQRTALTLILEASSHPEPQRATLEAFAAACREARANVRVVLLDERQGPDLAGARHHRMARWDVADTAIAIGRMVGRRPPTGELAHDLWEVTGGYRSAVGDVVRSLVASDQVRTEGNQVHWARTRIELEPSAELTEELDGRLQLCTKQQILVLQAVAKAGAMSAGVLGKVLPNPDAIAGSIDQLVDMGLLTRVEDRVEPATPPLRQAILEARGGFPMAVLERMLLKAAPDLPDTPFKIRGLVQRGDVHLAVAAANREAERLIEEGRWLSAEAIVEPIYDALGPRSTGSDGISQVYVNLARAGVIVAPGDDRNFKAAESAQQMAGTIEQAIRCQLVLADIQRARGQYRRYSEHLHLAWDLAREKSKNPALKARAGLAVALGALVDGEVRRAARILEDLDTSDDSVPSGTRVRVLAALAICDVTLGRLADGIGTAQHAVDSGTDDPAALADAVNALGTALRRAGRLSEALEVLADGAEKVRFAVDPRPYLKLVLTTGWCEVDLHRLGPAQECVDELHAAFNPTELLHSRIESQLLEARVKLLSGEPNHALAILDDAHHSAKQAGLKHLSHRAQADLFRATARGKLNQGALSKWFEGAKIGFMASRDLWTFVRAFRTMAECAVPVPDPDVAFSSLEKAIESEPPPQLAVELLLARARYAESKGDRANTLVYLRDAARGLQGMADHLADAERGAMRVHPWALRIRDALAMR